MYIFTKKKFYFFLTAVIALTLTIVLVGCNFTNANSCVNNYHMHSFYGTAL